MTDSVRRLLVATIFACLLAIPVFAAFTGDLEGTVLDPSDAAVVNAKVTIKNSNTGATRLLMTNEFGQFSAPQLDLGSYDVTVEKDGFRTYTQKAVVRSGEKTRIDVKMEIGKLKETVVVESGAIPTLDVATAQVSDSVNVDELLAYPNQARDPVNFATLSPGTVPVTKDNPFLGVGSFNSNGSRGRANNITLDGVTAADISTTGESGSAFVQDNVQEVKVITNNFDAEFGRNSGAQVQIITKGGTNEYHGSAYWYHQNTALGNARDFFDTTGKPTPIIQSQGGVTFGAPIYKNHTFFYGSWEIQRTRGAGSSAIANVLTTAQAAAITDPTSAAIFKSDGSPHSSTGTLSNSSANTLDADAWTLRVDQLLRGGKDSVFAKYSQFPSKAVSPGLTFIQTNLAGFGASNTTEPRDVTIGYTAGLTANLVNQFRFGFGRSNPKFPINSPFPQGPRIIFLNGLSNFGESEIIPQGRTQNTFQYADTVSWVKGRHTFKFGGDINRYQAPSFFPAYAKGRFFFPDATSFEQGNPVAFQQIIGPTTLHNFALDHFWFVQDDYRLTDTLTLNLGFRLESSGGVSELRNLLSNLDTNNHTPLGVLGTGPLGGVDLGGTAFHRNWNPAPRLGLAWNPGRGKLVFRGGYGIAYDFLYQNPITNLVFSPPFVSFLTIQSFTGGNTYANLVAGTAPAQLAATASVGKFNPLQADFGSFSPVDQHLKNPRNQQWNVGVEYEAIKDLVLKVTYVGTRNDRLQVSQPINLVKPQNIPAPPTSLADQNAREAQFVSTFQNEVGPAFLPGTNNLRDPRFDNVVQVQSTGTSSFHALELQAIRRLRNGLTFNVNYTWSHSLDDISDALGVLINDSALLLDPGKPLSFNRANSQFDIRQRVVLGYNYEIPYAKHFHGFAKYLLDGWAHSGIFSSQTGFPATIVAAPVTFADGASISDLLLDGASNVSVDGNPTKLHPVASGNKQPAVLPVTEPLLEHDGTSGRNHLRLAGLTDYDVAFSKLIPIPIKEGTSFQLRWEIFNVLNHANLGGYQNIFGSGSFNTYTATATNQRQMQATAKFVF